MLNVNTVLNSTFFKGEFNSDMVKELVADNPFPYALIRSFIHYVDSPSNPARDKVSVEICRWAEDMGVLSREDFDISLVWEVIKNDLEVMRP